MYNWQQKDWRNFTYRNVESIDETIYAFYEEAGHMNGILKGIPEDIQTDAMINIMVAEAVKTSEIEGEYISRPDVMSSIRNNLGLNAHTEKMNDKKAEGAGELMVAVRKNFADPLTDDTLFDWHKMLLRESKKIATGVWRTHKDAMQVISGTIGKEKIHFEAPPSAKVPAEMKKFITWFNATAPGGKAEIKKAPVRSAIAHLYFESIHPFEDGNGRIGRAVAEKALSQTVGRPVLLSLSQIIEADKKRYYSALEQAQKSNEITEWVRYFVSVILKAQQAAAVQIEFTLKKTKFFDHFKGRLNERGLKVIRKMIEAEPKGFEGGMTAKKYGSITKVSKATATRDLQLLSEMGVIVSVGGGRSTGYQLRLEDFGK